MGSDNSDGEHHSRRRKHDDDESSSRKRRHHDREESDKPRRRERSRSTSVSRKRERRTRSKTPDGSDRPRSRDRERKRDRERDAPRDKPRSRSRSRDRERRNDRDSSRTHHRRRKHRSSQSPSGDDDQQKKIDYKSSRQLADTARQRRPRSPGAEKASFSSSRAPVRQSGPLPDQNATFAVSTGLEPEKPIEKPNFAPSGALAAAANAVTTASGESVTLKYHEPPEARKPPPKDRWKLFIFKGDAVVDTVELSQRSCWLVGRETAVVDLPAEHPSVSKQHAVIQFRFVEKRNEFGDRIGRVKPYLIDLESANGTVLNGDKVPDSRYLELRDKDVVRFGLSTREYVFMLDRE